MIRYRSHTFQSSDLAGQAEYRGLDARSAPVTRESTIA